jgi:hypothetical protein
MSDFRLLGFLLDGRGVIGEVCQKGFQRIRRKVG